jgi:LmbE family N-acetylglucosaminyl deacetylase
MRGLIVVAHPDDEVLGCGATAAALAAAGVEIHSCILSGSAEVRRHRPEVQELLADTKAAQALLGLQDPIIGDFPNIEFNTVPHLRLVQFIEEAIIKTNADLIFTQHPHDLNNDHQHTSMACQAAARIFQRRPNIARLRGLYFMEILSATDWAFPDDRSGFRADTFFEIGENFLERKLEALRAYRGVVRPFPHPRSEEIVKGLAAYRGGQAGMRYAEAFQTAFHVLDTSN